MGGAAKGGLATTRDKCLASSLGDLAVLDFVAMCVVGLLGSSGKPSRAQFTCYEISHLLPNASSRRRRFAPEGRPQPPRPPREGARLSHPPCLRPARVTVICLIRWCSLSSPDASHRSRERSLRRGAGAPPPPPTGRRWGYFLRVSEGAQRPLYLELGPDPPLLGRAALC